MKNIFLLLFPSFFAISQVKINLSHIDYLTRKVLMDGDTVAIIMVYSEYPDYRYVEAPGEGIACVDDASRAVIAYLMHYQIFHDEHSLNQAKYLLRFIFKMQAEDGGFYNFVFSDMTINRSGATSNNDTYRWWSCRALWAMGSAFNIFSKLDIEKDLIDTLRSRIERNLSKAVRTINKSDYYERFIAWNVPAQSYWLLENGTDASAEALLGASLYYEISKSEKARWVVEKLAKAISTYQFGDCENFPFGVHPSFTPNVYIWHSWGSRQAYSLLVAGKIFNNQQWIESAKKEIDCFYKRMLLSFDLTDLKPYPFRGDQINYGITPIVQAFSELGKLTGDTLYSVMAGLYATWWLGNNIANRAVYDTATGRFYDAVRKDGSLNLNSGAESVSEGLIGMLTVLSDTIASKYLHCRTKSDNSYFIVEAENFTTVQGNPAKISVRDFNYAEISGGNLLEMRNGDVVRIKFNAVNVYPDANEYLVYVQYRKRALPQGSAGIEISLDSSPKIYLDMSGSIYGDYIWVDKFGAVFELSNGEHTLEVFCKSEDGEIIWIDYFMFQPVVERKIFIFPDGREFKVERKVLTSAGRRKAEDSNSDFFEFYPNPFNSFATITFSARRPFKLKIFDISGREVADLTDSVFGTDDFYLVYFNAQDFASGFYLCYLLTSGFVRLKKVVLLK